MTKKMTKDVKAVVEYANKVLATKRFQTPEFTDRRTLLHSFISSMLINFDMYHGFEYCELLEPDSDIIIPTNKETSLMQFIVK